MKTKTLHQAYKLTILGLSLVFTSCSSMQNMAYETDDVYGGSPNQVERLQEPVYSEKQSYSTPPASEENYPETRDFSQVQEQYSQEAQAYSDQSEISKQEQEDENYLSSEEFDYDDYYDYAYAARLKRFYSDYEYDYYSDYYTNLYWYNRDPFYYGTSIYLGYDWWYPSYSMYYRPGWYLGFSWGWNYSPSWYGGYWGSFYNPYYLGYYHGYHHGYYHGYHHAYWGGDYCYNPYDYNTYTQSYYGPRGGSSNASGVMSNVNRSGLSNTNRSLPFSERYEKAVAMDSRVSSTNLRTETNSNRTASSGVRNGATSSNFQGGSALNERPGVSGSTSTRRINTTSEVYDRAQTRLQSQSIRLNSSQMGSSSSGQVGTDTRTVRPQVSGQATRPSNINTQTNIERPSSTDTRTVRPNVQNRNTNINNASQSVGQSRYGRSQTSTGERTEIRTPSVSTRSYQSPSYGKTRSNSNYSSPQYNRERSSNVAPTRATTPRSTESRRSYSTPSPSSSNRSSSYNRPSSSSSSSGSYSGGSRSSGGSSSSGGGSSNTRR